MKNHEVPGRTLPKNRAPGRPTGEGWLLGAILCLFLGGCVVLPIPLKENKILVGKPVLQEQLAFLTPAVTLRSEVIEKLGNPHVYWVNTRIITYDWDMRQGVLLWAVGAYYTGDAGISDIPRHHILILQFDENDRLLRFEKTTRPITQSYSRFLKQWAGMDEVESREEVQKKTVVLFRIQCIVDHLPVTPFTSLTLASDPIFYLGTGGFKTLGEPVIGGKQRFLSDALRQEGWTYFEFPPGIHYLTISGPDSSVISLMGSTKGGDYLKKAPRWKLVIPENPGLIYAGTLEFRGRVDGSLLFGGKIVKPVNGEEIPLKIEGEAATRLLMEHFPDKGAVTLSPMERWHPGDPVVLQFP